ncbi:MAG: hypothetical protein ACT4PP_03085 [Sporichthyaceae bacterium]
MAHTITLRLTEAAYEMVKQYAAADQRSMNSWIEAVLDVEDMRRRCAAHEHFLTSQPEALAFSQAWAARNLEQLGPR